MVKKGIGTRGLKHNSHFKKKLVKGILLTIGLLSIGFIILGILNRIDDNVTVLTVNNQPVTYKEFETKLHGSAANVTTYFNQKYGVTDNKNFWTTTYNEERPIDKARQSTLESIVKAKVQLILAQKYKLISDISYDTFLKSLNKENGERKDKIKNKQPIYGPVQFGERDFYNYVLDNLAVKIKQKLQESEFHVDDNELKSYYEENKIRYFSKQDSITVQKIVVEFMGQNGERDEQKVKQAKEKIEQARDLLGEGVSFEEVANAYNQKGTREDQTFDNETRRVAVKLYPELLTEARKLKEGNVSGIIESNGAFVIMKCIEIKSGLYYPYDEIKENIKKNYIDMKYDELIEKLAKEAKVSINNKIFNKTNIR